MFLSPAEFEAMANADCQHENILRHYDNLRQVAPTGYSCKGCGKAWTPKEFALARRESDWYFTSEVAK